jgi:hypothetical protein
MIKRGRKSSEIVRQKFNKGLNTYKNFFNLEEGQSPSCLNIKFNNDASISKRLGSSTMNTIALESTAGYGMFEFGVLNPGGGLDSNTKLLLHMNGVDGSTTFTDSETTPKTVTVVGSTQIDTAQSKFGGASGLFTTQLTNTEIDFMEYSSDANAQAAYVTNATEVVNQQSTNDQFGQYLGDTAGDEIRAGQGFILSSTTQVTAVEIRRDSGTTGTPSGNWTLRIETNNAGVPSGTLANANASIVVVPPAEDTVIKGTFATPFLLNGATTYWLVVECDNQTTNNYWKITMGAGYASGTSAIKTNATWVANASYDFYFKVYTLPLQSFSESTIKTQGSYALKGVAEITNSSAKTLTRTIATAKNLTGVSTAYFDVYSARTGSMIRLGIKDTGGTTTYKIAAINSNNTWETQTLDLSSVADADKDSIYQIIVQVLDAASANTFYIDNFYYQAPSQGFLTIPASNDFPSGKRNFTIDEWLMFKSTSASQTIIGQGVSANDNWVLRWNSAAVNTSNCFTFQSYSAGVLSVNLSAPFVANTSSFYHLEVGRQSTSNFYIFVGGSNIASTGTLDGFISGSAGLLKIGVNVVTTNNTYYEGWRDELRISDVIRHNANFTTPTSEYYSATLQQRRLICASGTGIYNSEDIGKTWAVIQTSRTAGINYFSLVKDYVINTNENYDVPQYWAGTSTTYFANISTAAPACKHTLSHQGFAIFLNESSHKTSMYYVDQNDLFTEPFSNFALPTDRNDELTGGFSLGRNLYVSSKYKIFRLNYIGGSPDWEYIEVRGFGFVPKTIKKISLPNAGEAVIGLDWTKKLRIFLGSEDEIISDTIQFDNNITPFYLDNINSLELNKCWAENDKKNGLYKLFLAYGDSSTVSHCLNFNYRTGTLYPDNGRPFNSGVLAADTADNLYMLGCNYNGRIHCMDSGNTDAGISVDDCYVSPFYYNQSPSRVHKAQQIDLFFSESSSGSLCYQERNDFRNEWGETHHIILDKAGSCQQIRHTQDIPETQNVYQFRLGSSANTAETWQLNLIDFSNSDIGIGEA